MHDCKNFHKIKAFYLAITNFINRLRKNLFMKSAFTFSAFFLTIIVFLYSCTKTDDPIYDDCQLTRTVTPGDTSNMSTRYY